ncbi:MULTISPECIES: cell division protein ZapA [unclassified Psychrobacter]|uniref:cell division protein ZapA n=1 Tax=unclassified Psychrobacter TaxID=196806 RepID=UPI0025B3F024|nr:MULTISPECIES: cell division protein ZapA [unclassified Psychrobacter]MDN3452644.1 cell division protein ZapA [Psychrobacter sp. APC 3350]MDN3503463.1 cell division protein ZapA [Psychrobacter sp. 5A.1]
MTDDQNKSIAKLPKTNQVQNTQTQRPQVQSTQTQNTALTSQKTAPVAPSTSSTMVQSNPKIAKAPEPQIKKVDIAIAGVTYPIFCPVHEQEELLSAVSYINNHALELKREAPSLSQESILVLCCLNLYEKIHASQKNDEDRIQQDKQSEALLNKIMKDAHSIL